MTLEIFNKIYDINKYSDPEFSEILNQFINTQILKHIKLTDREITLTIIANLIANQSYELYQDILKESLDVLTPIEIKEIIYQSIIYVGLSKIYKFLELTNEIFKEENIDIPLESQATIKEDERQKVGYELQVRNFGKDFIDSSIENTPENQKHIWDFISSFAYGDFYTRNGLNDKDRELITFTFILSLRGCENQLKIHTIGNIEIGNDKDKLIDIITLLIPFIGFPRMHNALAIINEV